MSDNSPGALEQKVREEAFEFVVNYGLAKQFAFYVRANDRVRLTKKSSESLERLAENNRFDPKHDARHATLWQNLRREVDHDE